MQPVVRRRASRTVTVGVVAALAATLTGCGQGTNVSDDYAQICRDNSTEKRLPDDDCNNHGGSAHWYYLPLGSSGRTVPAVGQPATGGSDSLPSGKTAARGISSDGDSVSRGGFGGSGSDGSHGS
ncbi:tRNA-dihydrouridine synthase [uncultured Microbacterium sp.]|uniref:tRNA-dihydrouridine synthase n=1 Tax=uncultured Microbacterium sp. TaxID=191216 RepID=UPI0025F656C1|nr:tRNA-dihydrouridine synthase [uncultured Microbacterium sp.]